MVEISHATIRQVADLSLRLGRLMLLYGADTAHVQYVVENIMKRLGYQGNLVIFSEGLLLTLENEQGLCTKIGPTISGTTVNMGKLAELHRIGREIVDGAAELESAEQRLSDVEHRSHQYPSWLVALCMGVTAASLARLFGGPWQVVGACVVVGIVTQLLRQLLSMRASNHVGNAAIAAFGGGLVAAAVMKFFPTVPPTLCLVAAGMILVPGVPLLNGIRDTLDNHIGTGIARLIVGTTTTLAIAFSLFLSAGLAGDDLPVSGSLVLLPVGEDLLFSALAGIGYAVLFNVPGRAAWACVICAMIGHGLRTAIAHAGLDLAAASLIGSFFATLIGRLVARQFRVPSVTFAFPGVVSMIPGAFAFRAGIGGLSILDAGTGTSSALIDSTISLAVTTVLVTIGIAIGLYLAMAAPLPRGPMFSKKKERLQ